MITEKNIEKIISILRDYVKRFELPVVSRFAKRKDPYIILISCLLSLRTKDEVTYKASKRLFSIADNPSKMIKLSIKEIEKLIYPVGFYKTKARRIIEISKIIINKYNGKVPNTLEELLKLPGVGRKTANLVLTEGFNKYGICVDTHVHRISNRFGFVSTKSPEETEFVLRKKLPKKLWKEYNKILVAFGQNICKPLKPLCNICPIEKYCPKMGVRLK